MVYTGTASGGTLAYGVEADTRRAVEALNQLANAADGVGAAVIETERRLNRGNATFAALASRYNDAERGALAIERATRRHSQALEDAARAAQREGIEQQRLAPLIAQITRAREEAALTAVRHLQSEQQALALTQAGYAQLATQVQASAAAQVAAAEQAAAAHRRATQAAQERAAAEARMGSGPGILAPQFAGAQAQAAILAQAAALEQLRQRYVPLAAAQAQYRSQLAEIAQAERLGAISAGERAVAVERLKASFADEVRTLNGYSVATEQAAAGSSRLGMAVGQAGFQIQDFATQVAMGQSAAVAFGVQFAQFAGFFGVGGAIAGAVVTVGLLAAQFIGLTDNTDTLARAVDAANDNFERMNQAAERRLRSLNDEADAVLRLANEYRAMGTAQAGGEAAGIERQGAALNLEAGRMRDALRGNLGSMGRRVFVPDGSRGDQFGLGDLGLSEGVGQFGRLRDLIEAVQSSAGNTTGALRELANEANNLARAGGSGASEFARLRDAALELLAPAQRLDEAQRNVAVQTLAVMQAMGQGSEALQAYAARFGALSGEILRTAASLAALRRDAVDIPGDRLRVEAQRAEQVLRTIREQGQAAGQSLQDRFTREDQIAQRVTRLTEDTRRALEAEGRSREEISQALREQQGEFVTLATRAVDGSRAVEEGLRRQGSAARSAAQDFGMLRQSASGLLVAGPSDERAIAEIQRVARGTALDPARFQRDAREAARATEQAQREVERFEQSSREAFGRIGENALDRIGQGVVGALVQGEQAVINWGSVSRSVIASVATDLIRLAAINPFTNAVFGTNRPTLGGALGSLGGAGAAAQGEGGTLTQAGSVFSLGRMFSGANNFATAPGMLANTGFGFADRFLNTGLTTFGDIGGATNAALGGLNGAGPATAAQVAAEGAGVFTVGNALGAGASILGGAYGIYSGLQRGGVGGATSALGGAIGVGSGLISAGVGTGLIAAGGSLAALGPPGMIAAAALAIIGSLLPGQKPSGREQGAAQGFSEADFVAFGHEGAKFSQEQRDQASSIVRALMQQEDAIASRVGFGAAGFADVRVIGGRGSGPGVVRGRIGGDNAAQIEVQNTEEGLRSFSEQASAAIFAAFREAAQGRSGDMAGIVRGSATAQELEQNLQWFETTYRALTATADQTGQFARQLADLRQPYDEAITKARELGLAEAALVANRDEAIARIQGQRSREIDALFNGLELRFARAANDNAAAGAIESLLFGIGQQNEAAQFAEQLRNLGLSAEQTADAMSRLGAVQAQEAVAREREVRARGAQEATGVLTSLRDFQRGLVSSDFSPLGSRAQYDVTAERFRAAADAAMRGDAAAIRDLQGASSAFLTSSRAVFGSGVQSVRDFEAVTQAISRVADLGADRLTAEFYADVQRTQTDRVVDVLNRLITEVAQQNLRPARAA